MTVSPSSEVLGVAYRERWRGRCTIARVSSVSHHQLRDPRCPNNPGLKVGPKS